MIFIYGTTYEVIYEILLNKNVRHATPTTTIPSVIVVAKYGLDEDVEVEPNMDEAIEEDRNWMEVDGVQSLAFLT